MDAVNGIQQLRKPFKGVVLALHGNEHRVGGGEHVDGEETERWGAVDEDVIISIADRRNRLSHRHLTIRPVYQLHLGARQIGCRGGDIQVRELNCAEDNFVEGALTDQCVVDRARELFALQADAARRIPLRVAIYEQRMLLGHRQAGCEIDRGGRLSNPAFLIRYCNDSGHALLGVYVKPGI